MPQQYAVVATENATIQFPGDVARQVEAGEVVNVAEWDGASAFDPGPGLQMTLIEPGWGVVEGRLVQLPAAGSAPDAPPPVPASVTPRQLLLGLVEDGFITQDEALAAATTGAVPTAIEAVLAGMSGPQAFEARITWAKMTVAERADPLVAALGESRNMDAAALDDFFRLCATF